MFEKKKPLDEEELEDTKVAEEVTPGGIEVPKEESAKDAPEPEAEEVRDDVCVKEAPEPVVAKKDPNVFTERVLLGVDLIKSKSLEEIIEILDYQLEAIKNLAIKTITEYRKS